MGERSKRTWFGTARIQTHTQTHTYTRTERYIDREREREKGDRSK